MQTLQFYYFFFAKKKHSFIQIDRNTLNNKNSKSLQQNMMNLQTNSQHRVNSIQRQNAYNYDKPIRMTKLKCPEYSCLRIYNLKIPKSLVESAMNRSNVLIWTERTPQQDGKEKQCRTKMMKSQKENLNSCENQLFKQKGRVKNPSREVILDRKLGLNYPSWVDEEEKEKRGEGQLLGLEKSGLWCPSKHWAATALVTELLSFGLT